MGSSLDDILYNSTSNGLGLAVLAVLSYMGGYHLFLYAQNRRIHYLYYSLFILISVIMLLPRIENAFTSPFLLQYKGILNAIHFPLQVTSYMAFAGFILEILKLKEVSRKYYRLSYGFIIGSIVLFVLLYLFDVLFGTNYDILIYSNVFVPVFTILTFIGIYFILKADSPVKYPILIGLLILQILSTYVYIAGKGKSYEETQGLLWIYYLAVLLQNLAFAIAIGKDQALLFKEKNHLQKQYIRQLEENQKIKENINQVLEQEIEAKKEELLNAAARQEHEKQKNLKLHFENELNALRLQSLRSQMNPHFIFNALNSIKLFLINNHTKDAVYYLNKFSKLIRHVLEHATTPSISLEKELEILQIYVQIENLRTQLPIDYTVTIAPEINPAQIPFPPLLLQPLLENAILHGLALKETNKSLSLQIQRKAQALVITVTDNGIGRKAAAALRAHKHIKKNSLGVKLVEERLQYFSKTTQKETALKLIDLTAADGSPAGTQVKISIAL